MSKQEINDKKILDLKALIETKKKALKTKKTFVPITNCSLELDGVRHNIHVLQRETLICVLVKLNSYRLSAIDLGVLEQYMVSNYKVEDWITDIKARLEVIAQKEEETKLQALEKKLHNLLSTDKQVELEIEGIENLLK